MRRSGFTLIELMVVVLLLAIVATAVTLRVQSPLHASNLRNLLDEIRSYDDLTRLQAVGLDRRLQVEIDLDAGTLRRLDPAQRDSAGEPLQLPDGFRIHSVMTRGEQLTSGSIALQYSSQGLSSSYALGIEGPKGTRTWLVFAGLSGRTIEMDNEDEAERIIELTQSRADVS